jgi:hypothetical protein
LNKGTPEQERFKQRMSDLRGVALTQKNIFNLRSKENRPIGFGSVTRVNEYLGDRKLGRGKTKKKRKLKRNKN